MEPLADNYGDRPTFGCPRCLHFSACSGSEVQGCQRKHGTIMAAMVGAVPSGCRATLIPVRVCGLEVWKLIYQEAQTAKEDYTHASRLSQNPSKIWIFYTYILLEDVIVFLSNYLLSLERRQTAKGHLDRRTDEKYFTAPQGYSQLALREELDTNQWPSRI